MNKKKLYNNNKLIKNKIKNISRNKDNNNNNIGKNSFLIYKTEYSETILDMPKIDLKGKKCIFVDDVFATGGIGGVHRGAEQTWDVSADLREFSKSPVIVICAGAKAILDLPKTIEYLETEGVSIHFCSGFTHFFTL